MARIVRWLRPVKTFIQTLARYLWRAVVWIWKQVKKLVGAVPKTAKKINEKLDKAVEKPFDWAGLKGILWDFFIGELKWFVKAFVWIHIIGLVFVLFFAFAGTIWAAFGSISPAFAPEVRRWEPHIVAKAQQHGLDPNEAAIIMQLESCGDPTAVSKAGAQGLYGVMPLHFAAGEDPQNIDNNADRGLAYYAERKEAANGDVRLAFAQYNGGPGAISESAWLPETVRYVELAYGIYQDLQENPLKSETLENWFEAGGYSFCSIAAEVPITEMMAASMSPTTLLAAIPFPSLSIPSSWYNNSVINTTLPYFGVSRVPGICDSRGLPVSGGITQYYHYAHGGIDMGVVENTPVPTTISGTVLHAGWNNQGYGNLVIVDNGNGVQTYYAHLNSFAVEYGQKVSAGTVIGGSGNTGTSTGPHVHYEVRNNWVRINPLGTFAQANTCR